MLQPNTSVRQIAKLLKKFHVQNGDILALRYKTPTANKEVIDLITEALGRLKIDALVIVVEDFDDLSALNETEMNSQGWYKLKTLAKIMKLPENKTQ
jgi:hypothetical protein